MVDMPRFPGANEPCLVVQTVHEKRMIPPPMIDLTQFLPGMSRLGRVQARKPFINNPLPIGENRLHGFVAICRLSWCAEPVVIDGAAKIAFDVTLMRPFTIRSRHRRRLNGTAAIFDPVWHRLPYPYAQVGAWCFHTDDYSAEVEAQRPQGEPAQSCFSLLVSL